MPYYIPLIIVLTVQPAVEPEPDTIKLLPEIEAPNTKFEVMPNPFMELSVKSALEPDHIAMKFPARPTEPDLIV
jgi:hypothetical protein